MRRVVVKPPLITPITIEIPIKKPEGSGAVVATPSLRL